MGQEGQGVIKQVRQLSQLVILKSQPGFVSIGRNQFGGKEKAQACTVGCRGRSHRGSGIRGCGAGRRGPYIGSRGSGAGGRGYGAGSRGRGARVRELGAREGACCRVQGALSRGQGM